jgi:hypothetical protein
MPPPPTNLDALVAQLRELTETLERQSQAINPRPSAVKQVRKTVTAAYERLRDLVHDLDPIQQPAFVFDPSNPMVLGRLAGLTLMAQPRLPLAAVSRFYGSGVYAIYYRGAHPAYAPLRGSEHPIYVGKADPADATSKTAFDQGQRLSTRLNDHRKNILKASTTLHLEDFDYRALVVQTGWQGAAESYLIDLFKPVWNNEVNICYGFGKHGDDPATRRNLRSPWDTLHPGRSWAHRDPTVRNASTGELIFSAMQAHFASHKPLASLDSIVKRFLEEMRPPST